MRITLIAFIILSINIYSQNTYEFLRVDVSPRTAALGGSFAAVNDDADAIFYNPAGLSYLSGTPVSLSFTKYLVDIKGKLYCKETDESLIKTHYKELYYSLKKSNFRNESFNIPDMDRASYYAFLLTSAFSSCSYTAAGFSGFKLKTFLKKLQNKDLQKKLAKINIVETLGFEEVIKKYDSPETFIYLDPPYYEAADKRSGWYGTKDEFGQSEHTKLLELLKTLKSKWMLSYYYFDELEKQLPKDQYVWLEKDFFRSSASFSENKSLKGTELLILNYDPNHITSNTPQSEKLIDEIEDMNDGGFIISLGDGDEVKVSNLGRVVVEPPKKDEVYLPEPKKEENIDDFWNS